MNKVSWKTKLLWVGVGVLLVAVVASGWIYSVVKNNQSVQDSEIAQLNASFIQQYGDADITISQLVYPDKVYAALGTDSSGTKYVFVNIAGVWGLWWQSDK